MTHAEHIKQAIGRDIDDAWPDIPAAEAAARKGAAATRTRHNHLLPLAVAAAVIVIATAVVALVVRGNPTHEPASAGSPVTEASVTGSWHVQQYTVGAVTHTPPEDQPLTLTLKAPTPDGAVAMVTNSCTPSTAWWKLNGNQLVLTDGWTTPAMECPPGTAAFNEKVPGFLDLTNSWPEGATITLDANGTHMTLTTSAGSAELQRLRSGATS